MHTYNCEISLGSQRFSGETLAQHADNDSMTDTPPVQVHQTPLQACGLLFMTNVHVVR